jgi:hypothetical protein
MPRSVLAPRKSERLALPCVLVVRANTPWLECCWNGLPGMSQITGHTPVARFLLFVVKEDGVERSEFVNIGEAARRLGTSEPAIRRRIQRGDLQAYAHPLDMRVKLLKIADLDRYGADVRELPVGEKEVAIA